VGNFFPLPLREGEKSYPQSGWWLHPSYLYAPPLFNIQGGGLRGGYRKGKKVTHSRLFIKLVGGGSYLYVRRGISWVEASLEGEGERLNKVTRRASSPLKGLFHSAAFR
jgi:hypothetical protein